MGDTSWQCRCRDTQKVGVSLSYKQSPGSVLGDFCHLPGDVWHHIALRWWICPLVPPDTCATIRCLTWLWKIGRCFKAMFLGVGYKTHHDVRSRRRNSWKSLTGTMSLYHSMAFSDLEVCFLRLNFWWSCTNRDHQDDSPIFVRNKKQYLTFRKIPGRRRGEFSLSNRPINQKVPFWLPHQSAGWWFCGGAEVQHEDRGFGGPFFRCNCVGHAKLKLQVSAIMRWAFGFCKIFFSMEIPSRNGLVPYWTILCIMYIS